MSPHGVRVVCLRSTGSPDAAGVREAVQSARGERRYDAGDLRLGPGGGILLRRLPTLAEVVDVAALMASDRASAMTAAIANVTCGEMLD